jgi:hypothetical protein
MGKYTFSYELPLPCNDLYDTIIHLKLDSAFEAGESEVNFIKAIRVSINTEGCRLYELLQTKKHLRI